MYAGKGIRDQLPKLPKPPWSKGRGALADQGTRLSQLSLVPLKTNYTTPSTINILGIDG